MLQSSIHSLPPVHGSPIPDATVINVERVRLLRRAFLRKYLRRRPTRIEALALDRAAWLSALAEALRSDPAVHPDTVTRADGAASRARVALSKLRPPKEPLPPSLQELMGA
jgi:hypothetical protein